MLRTQLIREFGTGENYRRFITNSVKEIRLPNGNIMPGRTDMIEVYDKNGNLLVERLKEVWPKDGAVRRIVKVLDRYI